MNADVIWKIIIGLIFSIGWGVLFWSVKSMRNDIKELFAVSNKQELKIQSNDNKIKNNRDKINHNEEKLWSEEKLSKVIENVIEKQFLKWENKLMKEGKIPVKK